MTKKFKVGDKVMRIGTIVEIDSGVAARPYLVRYSSDNDQHWLWSKDIELIESSPPSKGEAENKEPMEGRKQTMRLVMNYMQTRIDQLDQIRKDLRKQYPGLFEGQEAGDE